MDNSSMRSGIRMWIVRCITLAMLFSLGACAMVGVSQVKPHDNVAERRADMLGSGRLSDGTVQALNVVALTADVCAHEFASCTDTVIHSSGLTDEQRLSTLSELWMGRAMKTDRAKAGGRSRHAGKP